jgi:hypothetical protein
MGIVQWIVAAGTAVFVALVGYFQWRTAHQKAALDLFDRRHELYDTIRKTVGQITTNSPGFDYEKEIAFLSAKGCAYFFFGDDVTYYLEELWHAIVDVQAADSILNSTSLVATPERQAAIESRQKAFKVVAQFYKVGQPLFGRYMRFDQQVCQPLFDRCIRFFKKAS